MRRRAVLRSEFHPLITENFNHWALVEAQDLLMLLFAVHGSAFFTLYLTTFICGLPKIVVDNFLFSSFIHR